MVTDPYLHLLQLSVPLGEIECKAPQSNTSLISTPLFLYVHDFFVYTLQGFSFYCKIVQLGKKTHTFSEH